MLLAVRLMACQIPVFRYALERWEPDSYRLLVVYESPCTPEQETWITALNRSESDGHPINLTVELVDVSGKNNAEQRALVPSEIPLPAIVLQFPERHNSTELAWVGTLNEQNVTSLLDSPVRQELAKRLLDGQSAVWLLVETGDPTQDESAYERLEQGLHAAQARLSLPQPEVLEKDEAFRPDTKVALRLEFSVIRVKRDDPSEAILHSILRHSEPGLSQVAGPLAIPVYGRGRTYFALAGDGIHQQNMDDSCQFVVGACSCQVKAQNPGVDLPMAVDWSSEVTDAAFSTVSLPELSGLGELAAKVENVKKKGEEPLSAAESPENTSAVGRARASDNVTGGLFRGVVMVIVALATAVALASLWIRRGEEM